MVSKVAFPYQLGCCRESSLTLGQCLYPAAQTIADPEIIDLYFEKKEMY